MNTIPYPIWEKISIEEIENKYTIKDDRLGDEPVIFGFVNFQWIKIIEAMQENDEFYFFCSDANSWGHLAGREGIALVRDEKIIDSIITRMN